MTAGYVEPYLAVGAALFVLGALGFLTRRNLILIVLSAEMMLHGVSLTLVTFGHVHHTLEGQSFTVFILTVAACEAGLALALILALYQRSKSLDVELWSELREPDLPPPLRTEAAEGPPSPPFERRPTPTLAPAGYAPDVAAGQESTELAVADRPPPDASALSHARALTPVGRVPESQSARV